MSTIRVTIDDEKVKKKLGDLKDKSPRVAAKALNKTAKDARKKLAEKAQEAYTVKKKGFYGEMKIKSATAGNLDAIIRSSGSPISLSDFSVRARKGAAAAAQVVKGSGFKPLDKSGIKAWKGMNGLIWQRKGAPRLPVKVLRSNSVPVMIGSEKHVYGIIKPDIQSDLNRNIEAEIKKLTG